MTDAGEEGTLVELLRALAHPVRLKLVFAILGQELAVSQIETATQVGQPLLSQQLGVLRKANIVETRREAKQIFYRLCPAALEPLRTLMAQLGGDQDANASDSSNASAAHFARILS